MSPSFQRTSQRDQSLPIGSVGVQVVVILYGTPVFADEDVTVQILGDGEILGIENGRPDDLTPYSSHTRSTLCGRAVVYVRVMSGPVTLYAGTKSGLRAELEV